MNGKVFGALILLILAGAGQNWIGPMAFVIAGLAWVVLFGRGVIYKHQCKTEARRCPYCSWGTPHTKGVGCKA